MTVVAFDFDGTLSDSEMTVLLGEQCDAADRMDEITERAMNDEIDYAGSLRQRCALLEGLADADAGDAFDQVRLRPGAAGIIDDLRAAGVHVAILTGGFERGVAAALDAAGVSVDTIVANRLSVADGALTGDVEGPLIEGTKDDALAVLAAAGLAVGFAPKPAVEPACDVVVDSMAQLRDVLDGEGLL